MGPVTGTFGPTADIEMNLRECGAETCVAPTAASAVVLSEGTNACERAMNSVNMTEQVTHRPLDPSAPPPQFPRPTREF